MADDDKETEKDDKPPVENVEPAPETDWVKSIEIKRILVDDLERRDE